LILKEVNVLIEGILRLYKKIVVS